MFYSACGGNRAGRSMPVLTAYFPVLAKGTLGKGRLPKLEQVVPIYSLSVDVLPTTKHWPDKNTRNDLYKKEIIVYIENGYVLGG